LGDLAPKVLMGDACDDDTVAEDAEDATGSLSPMEQELRAFVSITIAWTCCIFRVSWTSIFLIFQLLF
jgi:hypothetical protein